MCVAHHEMRDLRRPETSTEKTSLSRLGAPGRQRGAGLTVRLGYELSPLFSFGGVRSAGVLSCATGRIVDRTVNLKR